MERADDDLCGNTGYEGDVIALGAYRVHHSISLSLFAHVHAGRCA